MSYDYNELSDREKDIWDFATDRAWDAGWEEGYDVAINEGDSCSDVYDDGYHAGHAAGAEAEQARIQFVLQMMFDSSLNLGQGNKAVQYRNMMDLLKPVEIQTYSDED